jgi:hypothetical protein
MWLQQICIRLRKRNSLPGIALFRRPGIGNRYNTYRARVNRRCNSKRNFIKYATEGMLMCLFASGMR